MIIVATFGPTTAWAGRTISYDAGEFVLEGHGRISAAEVLMYDRSGHLTWAYDGLQQWAQQRAAAEAARRATPVSAGPAAPRAQGPHAGGPQVVTNSGGQKQHRRSRRVVLAMVLTAVVALIGVAWVWPAIRWATADTADLISHLADDNAGRREEARQRLVEKGAEAVGPLREALASQDETQRVEITLALLKLGGPEALAAVVDSLGDPSERVSAAAEAGLVLAGGNATPELIGGLTSSDVSVRTRSATLLGDVGDRTASKALIKALGDQGVAVRHAAAESLGKLRVGDAAPQLVELLADSDAEVRSAAETALGQLGAAATRPLLTALQDGSNVQKAAAARVCGELKIESAASTLVGLLTSPNSELNSSAEEGLKGLGKAATKPLLDGLESPDAKARRAAAKACGRLHVKASAARLAVMLRDENASVAWAAKNALVKLGAAAVPALSSRVGSDDGELKWVAANILIRIARSDPDAIKPLIDLLHNGSIDGVAARYAFFIRLGYEGSEDMLIDALNAYGNETMCEDYLNCENNKLEKAAEEWATSRGYFITTSPISSYAGPVWGSGN